MKNTIKTTLLTAAIGLALAGPAFATSYYATVSLDGGTGALVGNTGGGTSGQDGGGTPGDQGGGGTPGGQGGGGSPGDPDIAVTLSPSDPATYAVNQPYSLTIPLAWVNIKGAANPDYANVTYSLTDPSGTFSVSGDTITGTPSVKKPYPVELMATYQGVTSNVASFTIRGSLWWIDSKGVVHCYGAPDGSTHVLNGVTYTAVYTAQEAPLPYGAPRVCTSNVTDMESMFAGVSDFNQPLDNFDTSHVTNMYSMFHGDRAFNHSLANFDTSHVTNMGNMFNSASAFDQPLDFDTSSVTNMNEMFYYATSFNRPLALDTSSVTDMSFMFYNATAFDQSLRSFNTSNVTTMQSMFEDATSFNQPLTNFDTSNVTNMLSMFKGATAFNGPLGFNTSKLKLT